MHIHAYSPTITVTAVAISTTSGISTISRTHQALHLRGCSTDLDGRALCLSSTKLTPLFLGVVSSLVCFGKVHTKLGVLLDCLLIHQDRERMQL